MKKSNGYAKQGALIFGLGNGLLSVIKQLDEIKKEPELKFNWLELLISISKGALIGGAGGYVIGWFMDYRNSRQEPINLDNYLNSFSNSLMLKKDSHEFIELKKATENIINMLNTFFDDKLSGSVISHGSTVKGTALHENYDLDFGIPFKPRSFPNNQIMYAEVLNFFEERVGDMNIVDVREQSRSIGVYIQLANNEYRIDFAPYKLSKDTGSSGYLFVNKKGLFFDKSTIQKTDLTKLNHKFSNTQKRLIVLLKDWKEKNDLPLPSHFLEHLVLDAYKRNRGFMPTNISGKLIMILKHIADRLEIIYIAGEENSNNIVSRSVDPYDKSVIIQACKDAIEEFEYQPNSLVSNFK